MSWFISLKYALCKIQIGKLLGGGLFVRSGNASLEIYTGIGPPSSYNSYAPTNYI
jgi:hypothetical protein